MRRNKQPSIRLWALSAAVGVLSAAVMVTGAAMEAPRAEVAETQAVQTSTRRPRLDVMPVELLGNLQQFEDYENEKIEAALLDKASVLTNVKVTFYCCERRAHICGTGDGITASGTEVTPWQSVAVDPKVIPLGSTVLVDFGDGEIHYFVAEDVGGAVKGNHIDIAVEGHQEALELGVKSATVYWIKE